jgi:hypothetical protein
MCQMWSSKQDGDVGITQAWDTLRIGARNGEGMAQHHLHPTITLKFR